MADYYAAAAVLAIREPKQLLPKAEWAARRALELDASETGAHASLAVVQAIHYRRWDLAATHFRYLLENESEFEPYSFVLAPGLREAPMGSATAALVYRGMASTWAATPKARTGPRSRPCVSIRAHGRPRSSNLSPTG